jgi:cytochrome b6-f complex iron-sulfur subunit
MATIADLSGDEREQRAAELKRKMQEAAQKRASQTQETIASSTTPEPVTPPVTAVAEAQEAEAEAESAPAEETAESATPVASNGQGNGVAAVPAASISAPAAATSATPAAQPTVEDSEAALQAQMNRREFLMYSWGAALGLLTLEAGVASYLFLYPRFRAGEFGGDFFMPITEFGDPSSEPKGEMNGKFWMVTTTEGQPKAIYMVCTHLGCLYKWVAANNRFECPCHGSKFDHDGNYIEGPAPRSLDYFEVTVEGDQVAVHTGRKVIGGPATESPANAAV